MILAEKRRSLLKNLIKNGLVKVIEAPNAMAALIIEKMQVDNQSFDALWISSLVDSSTKGHEDNEFLNINSRMQNIMDIVQVSTKPIIYDGDTGSHLDHFVSTINKLELLGVSAVVIEDKTGLKQNSFISDTSKHQIDSIENFSNKIRAGKKAQVSEDFMLIARLESLILGLGASDALKRADAYIQAGADGILIHSKSASFDEVKDFSQTFRKSHPTIPLVIVPTTYSSIDDHDITSAGINIVIFANQLTRAAHKAMVETAQSILKHNSARMVESQISHVNELINKK